MTFCLTKSNILQPYFIPVLIILFYFFVAGKNWNVLIKEYCYCSDMEKSYKTLRVNNTMDFLSICSKESQKKYYFRLSSLLWLLEQKFDSRLMQADRNRNLKYAANSISSRFYFVLNDLMVFDWDVALNARQYLIRWQHIHYAVIFCCIFS